MFRSICVIAVISCLSSTFAETIQVRDAPGGETSFGTANGFFLEGTASGGDPIGTAVNSDDIILYDGAFSFETQRFGSSEWQSLVTYCIEPINGLGFGTQPGDLVGTSYETAPLTAVSGITAQEADYIEILWANAFADSITGPDTYSTSLKASAFQAIVWEFAQDDDFRLTGFVPTNNFRLDITWPYTAAVVDLANQWYNNIQSGQWTAHQPLIALTSDNSQDLIMPVPEPATAILLLLGLPLLRRR